jgi:hypothetical protein
MATWQSARQDREATETEVQGITERRCGCCTWEWRECTSDNAGDSSDVEQDVEGSIPGCQHGLQKRLGFQNWGVKMLYIQKRGTKNRDKTSVDNARCNDTVA